MFSSNTQKLYQALKELKSNYVEYKIKPDFKNMINICYECMLYSASTELVKWKTCRDRLIKLMATYDKHLQILNMNLLNVKELARLVEKEIYAIVNVQLKLVLLRHKIPEMTVLIRIADNFFAVNELTINGRLEYIKLGHKNYYPAKSLIKDCWIPKSEREKLDNTLNLLDVNHRENCFNQILESIEINIKKISITSSATNKEKFYKSRTTYSKYALFIEEGVKQIANEEKQLIKVLTLSP